jgi:hypothetical protein
MEKGDDEAAAELANFAPAATMPSHAEGEDHPSVATGTSTEEMYPGEQHGVHQVTQESISDDEHPSPSRGKVHIVPPDNLAAPAAENAFAEQEQRDAHDPEHDYNELSTFEEKDGDAADEAFAALVSFDVPDAEDGHQEDVGYSTSLLQAGKASRKKANVDARHMAIFDVISALLDLPGAADAQKRFLADVRLLSELTWFLDRPASSKLILSWGYLSDTHISVQSAVHSPGKKKNKVAGGVSGSGHVDLYFSDSWIIYREEVSVFLSSLLFFIRVFSIFGVTEPVDPLQFITLPAIEKGAQILQTALGRSFDLSQFVNSRSKGSSFGSQKVSYITMDTFCNWLTSLGLENDLNSIWKQKLRPVSPSASPERESSHAAQVEASVQKSPSTKKSAELFFENAAAARNRPSITEMFQNAEEKLLEIATNRSQLMAAWRELEEFSGASSEHIDIEHVDRWIVQLFPMLDFAPALRRAFRRLQQQSLTEQRQKELPSAKFHRSRPDKSLNTTDTLTSKEFGSVLLSVVYYRRM